MQYLLLICSDSSFTGRAEESDSEPWFEEMSRRGVWKLGDRLRPAAEAKTLRVRDGKLMVRDGPFAETKDNVAGYDIIDCADFDEAVEIASKHPVAKFGMIEIRPVWPI